MKGNSRRSEADDLFFASVFIRKISGREMANILSSRVTEVKSQPEKTKIMDEKILHRLAIFRLAGSVEFHAGNLKSLKKLKEGCSHLGTISCHLCTVSSHPLTTVGD